MVSALASGDHPMTKLSDTQTIILSAAAQRDDGNVLPLPGSLRGGAATKVVGALLSRGLIAERITDRMAKADPALNRVWRNEPDGRGVLLLITPAGLDAIGIEPSSEPEAAVEYRFDEGTNSAGEPAAGAATDAEEAPVEPAPKRRGRPRKAGTTVADVAPAPKTRDGTKQAQVISMLQRREGATIAQIVEATDWRPHYADARIMPM